ncbi:MAG: fructose-bisphosphate aldolase [Anaerolineae bacterium]|nr:fructose-bisphosphate aldolase [Anaerolineae bacterium]
MSTGKTIRLNHIFAQDGRSVVVAIDHGLPGMGPFGALKTPGKLLRQIRAAGADAILATPGTAARFAADIGDLGLILRLDGGATTLGEGVGKMRLIASVEDALRLGADAVAVMGFCGTPDEGDSLETLGQVAAECRRLGMPLMAEMLPLGYMAKPTVQEIVLAARIGAELGADIIKTKYTGTPDEYREVIETCYTPVLVLGGSAKAPDALFSEIRDSLRAGAAGVAIGRNIWQAEDVEGTTRRMVSAVHGATS